MSAGVAPVRSDVLLGAKEVSELEGTIALAPVRSAASALVKTVRYIRSSCISNGGAIA